ncbi:DUF4258 domain-containing protein [Crocosphaera chwakensis]|uniref:DUF4258 domain-containing protein n=1 Tax=Crocosphaera chwakensis CCY0110 TaxID=391612 RepID=A3IX10_9CHRO|nr:DUF4258 domain-containing protein [Crocosphaera chwakensis]EAZ89009.1 hypothetical protein CY0110_09061 [Crocosphaera chwakensis CCY0110]
MKPLEEIRQQLVSGQFDLTRHALKRIVERNITREEIMETGKNAIIIEDYPNDKYTPSCLLLGFTQKNRPLHIQTSRLDSSRTTIITLYEPDINEWINYSKRR